MDRFTGSSPVAPVFEFADTECNTWFERDRQHVELRSKLDDETIIEFWDEDVSEAIEDGFLNPRDYHGSIFAYAVECGIIYEAPKG